MNNNEAISIYWILRFCNGGTLHFLLLQGWPDFLEEHKGLRAVEILTLSLMFPEISFLFIFIFNSV
jgi:hypothetical protein